MKKIALLLLLSFPIIAQAQLTVEHIMQNPKWIGTSPSSVFWSANSKQLFFKWNPEKNNSDSLYVYDLSTKQIKKENYEEGVLQRDMAGGQFNSNHFEIVFSHNGDIYLKNIAGNTLKRITNTVEEEINPFFLKNESLIVYQVKNNLYRFNLEDGSTTQLINLKEGNAPRNKKDTTPQEKWLADEALSNSIILQQRKAKKDSTKAFLKAHEEQQLKPVYTGDQQLQQIHISADGKTILYVLYKEPKEEQTTLIPDYVTENGFTQTSQSRSKVGRENGESSLYLYNILKDTSYLISLDSVAGIRDMPEYFKNYPALADSFKAVKRNVYYNGIYINESGTHAIIDMIALDNKDRWLMSIDSGGKLSLINRQHDSAWIQGPGITGTDNGTIYGWINDNIFYYQSEATGYSHLYTYNFNTKETKQLTSGNYEVQDVYLNRDKKSLFLLTNEPAPGLQNIYRINADGSGKQQLTTMKGGYELKPSPDGESVAFRYSTQVKPWELYVQSAQPKSTAVQVTNKAISDSFKIYNWRNPEIFTFKARDSANVYARIYQPKEGTKNGAAVLFVHGAGYLQNVYDTWSYYFREMMFNNLLADKGYTVMDLDYRGSAGYGRDWRIGIYRYMGGKDLTDFVDAAHYLEKNYGIDTGRIGIYGGSYGGFITLMALFTTPDEFKAGAALRSVTDWAHYNHEYTCNILNEPVTDSIAYYRSSPINFTAGLKNNLLMCHGMLDDNVHFQDIVRVTQKLIEEGKNNWQLASFPLEDHSFVEPSSWTDEYKRILKLFDDTLVK